VVPSKISHYAILEKLGEGGMGVVYKAHDTQLNRFVALKFLPDRLTQSADEKTLFLKEARAAAGLNHNNICTIFGVEEDEGHIFIAMEFIDGGTLREKLPFAGVDQALTVAEQIGDALREAHEKGIVHRDIKPDNIMLTSKGQPKVMDFGLAKLKGEINMTRSSSTAGTLAYMAPELIHGGAADERSDIFSFGAVLYEMLTGKTPFRGEHHAAMMYSILQEEPESVMHSRRDVSPGLDRIIRRALQKDPGERYQSVEDMVTELSDEHGVAAGVPGSSAAAVGPRFAAGSTFPQPAKTGPAKKKFLAWPLLMGVPVLALVAYLLVGRHQAIDTLAVLPFENVGADPNTEYLADGMTETIINTLSQLSGLTVMSRSSVFHYKGKEADPQKVGRELGVKAVLVGRVMQRGDNLEIRTELVDVSNNSHLWGEQYSKKMSDILAVQEDIAKEISRQLSLKLIGEDEQKLTRRSTESTEAYQLYLKGRFHWNKRNAGDLRKAIDYFNQAIEKDPAYALAYSGLALTYAILPLYSGLPPKDFIPRTEAAAATAIKLDPTLAEPHAALGYSRCTYQWNWVVAEAELKRSIELNPASPTNHQWYGALLETRGRLEEALSEFKRAQELDPLSPIITDNLGEVYYYMQRYDPALEEYNKALEFEPNFTIARQDLGELYAKQKKYEQAISELEELRRIVGPESPFGLGDLGYAYARAGKKEKALGILKELNEFARKGYSLSVQTACVYAGLDEKDRVFECLEKGYEEANWQLGFIKIDPYWDDLRSDPRFVAILGKIGLD
jgi:serine/threonine-protein kinase